MPNKREIQDWLVQRLAEHLHQDPARIDIREPFSNYGLSSLEVVTLSGELEQLLNRRISPTVTYDYPNILTLSSYLDQHDEPKNQLSSESLFNHTSTDPIAVIGIGCRFPGANNPESFWQLIRDGVDMISEVPETRWPKHAYYHPDPSIPGKSVSYWGGFLENVDEFDPFFFGISPLEAKYMDPQQRLLLEISHEALDDAGQMKEKINGSNTGVFIGISVNEYSQLQFNDPLQVNSHSGTGSALSIAANRISYFFNFLGPSMAIDTACSSSLAAVHLACQSIRNGDCEMALAGGVNIILSPAHSIAFTKAGVLAPDGRCKTFDAGANGYVRGEGGGVVVLKRLSSALADGDPIQALVLGTAMRQDGRTNGLIAPSREGQEALLHDAYKAAGISPATVQYVEAHGTGTLLGDSMEAQALGTVLGSNRGNGPCFIGSVKTNIGHLESAAGIAGLIKVIYSIKYRSLPPSLHYHSPNPHIAFNDLNLKVNDQLQAWPTDSRPAIAGVSSFGFGGTNVHLVLSEAGNIRNDNQINGDIDTKLPKSYLLPLSAKSAEVLKMMASDFLELLSPESSLSIRDICYAASLRRSQDDYRISLIGTTKEQLKESLTAFLIGKNDPGLTISTELHYRPSKLAFVFSGQGGQWFGMGRDLLKQESVFSQSIEKIDQLIREDFGWSLMEELCIKDSESKHHEIDRVQPAIFAIQIALAELWKSWGIVPDAVVGHSMGEVAAAHIAGILSLKEAIQVICSRSKILKKLQGKGSMIATELTVDQAEQIIRKYKDDISIAAINSPTSTILSGNPEALDEVMDLLQKQNVFCKAVNVDVASHSVQIEVLRNELSVELKGLQPQSAQLPIYSTVSGTVATDINFNADYWIDNLRKPVLFSNAIDRLLDSEHSIFVEIGPHPILLGSIQQTVKPVHQQVCLLPSLRREEPEWELMLKSLAFIYTKGFAIAWKNIYPNAFKHVQLPLIPWQRQRYWIDPKRADSDNPWHLGHLNEKHFHPLLGERIQLANKSSSFIWQTKFDNDVLDFLKDHKINDEIVFPASGYIEMAVNSAKEIDIRHSHLLSDVVFKESMILEMAKPRSIQTLLTLDREGNFFFSVYSRTETEENWTQHASAQFIKEDARSEALSRSTGTPHELFCKQCHQEVSAEEFYQTLHSRGINYNKSFRVIQHLWINGKESVGRVSLPETLQKDTSKYQVHPALLDGCLQVIAATQTASSEHDLYLPTGCSRIQFLSVPGRDLWSHVILRSEAEVSSDILIADIIISDSHGVTIAEIIGFRLQRTSRRIRNLLTEQDTWLYRLQWQAQKESAGLKSSLPKEKHWLIFTDDTGLAEELAIQIEANGDRTSIFPYREFVSELKESSASLLYKIEQYIDTISSPLYGIVHLWSLSTPAPVNGRTAEVSTFGCYSVLFLVQVLSKRLAALPRLWLVTSGTQQVLMIDSIAVAHSTLWGLGKVVGFEIPDLKCHRIDLDPLQTNTKNTQDLFKQILLDDNEDQIAFRKGVRYVQRLLPFNVGRSWNLAPLTFREDSTYLITGGLGGLGIQTAKWMISHGAKHLVLLGRNKPSTLVTEIIAEIRQDGIEVFIEEADVSDHFQLEKVLVSIKTKMPVLRGIIHAAGILDDGSLLNLNAERMKNVLAPKVDGTWNLHHLTLDLSLDFFVLFSSAVSVLGSPGQGNYAAASAFLDAMAHYRRSLGLPAISINWGPWADVGLAAESAKKRKEQNGSTRDLIKVIKVDQGLNILEQLLTEPTSQVMVLPFDLKNLIELYPTAAGMPFLSEIAGNLSHVTRLYARPKLRQDYVAPGNDIERKLAELWRQTLHIETVGVQDSFFELGGDSVLAAQILTLAQKTFGIRIKPEDAFKAFTIHRLAEMLEAEIRGQIENMTEEEVEQRLAKNKC